MINNIQKHRCKFVQRNILVKIVVLVNILVKILGNGLVNVELIFKTVLDCKTFI